MGKFNYKNEEDFEKICVEAESLYSSIGQVHCPYFNEKIVFNGKGLRHLKFKSDQVARVREDQYSRFRLLHLAPMVLQESKTLQGIYEIRKFETQKTNSRWETILKEVVYYEFIAVMENVRTKVIVKQILGGEKHFWSVIPNWRIDKNNSRRILHNIGHEVD